MILVVGGTGELGRRITDRLLAQGEEVRLLTRPKPGVQHGLPGGAEWVLGDLKDPESLAAACAGVDTVVTTANATARSAPDTVDSVDLRGNLNLIDAAEAAGVGRFLFVSALGARPDHPMPLLRAKGVAEQRLRASGMAWTVLQANAFMDKLIPIVVGEPALSHRPVTLVGGGRRRHSFVAMDDVAAYAVAALPHPHARRQVIVVAGPEPLSWYDIVAAFENELGRDLPVRLLSPEEASHELPEFVTQLLTALDGYDSPIDMAQTNTMLGVDPTHLGTFIHDFTSSVHDPARDERATTHRHPSAS
jgi:uncharacterized protein YbjT (DUF2867 family)